MSITVQLAAILFTDIAGYTEIMGKDTWSRWLTSLNVTLITR